MNEHLIALVGAGPSGLALARLILSMENGYTLQFEEKQSEITSAWIDKMLTLESEYLPDVKPTQIQYGPLKKGKKGKVRKW